MHDLAKAPKKDREALFRSTASKTGMTDVQSKKTFGYAGLLIICFTEVL